MSRLPLLARGADVAVVSHIHNFAFVANPKAASTSVELALNRYQEMPNLNEIAHGGFYTKRHIPAVALAVRIPDWPKLYSFGIIRHPHDWVVSQLTYNAPRLSRPVPTQRSLEIADIDWCYNALKDRRGQPASPTATQWAFLCNSDGELMVSRLLNMDQLDTEWATLIHDLTIDVEPLPRLNSVRHPPAREWLSEEAKERTLKLWGYDYALYLKAQPR